MKITKNSEPIIGLVFALLLLLYLDPFSWFMYSMMQMLILALVVIAFAVFALFVWREGKADERENLHKLMASRAGFLAGAFILIVGIVWQSFQHQNSQWLIATLTVMVLSKVAGLLYGKNKF